MMNKYNIFICAIFLISIFSCSEDTLDVVRTGRISGKVIDKVTGERLSGAKITTNPASTTVFSDSLGNFKMNDIIVDDYSVQAELAGYSSAFESTTVIEGVLSQVSFELTVANTENLPPLAPT
ncbi:MAG TPA: carboxypeptidase-like regulatory domain-containing protein, partial [Aequorivita sp.]|nr:carboxypeptidase-like regulatory domain-containing protein [Aequorivita sp.]